jgi:hypothetical protein
MTLLGLQMIRWMPGSIMIREKKKAAPTDDH